MKGISNEVVQRQVWVVDGGVRGGETSGHANRWETKQAQGLAECSCP